MGLSCMTSTKKQKLTTILIKDKFRVSVNGTIIFVQYKSPLEEYSQYQIKNTYLYLYQIQYGGQSACQKIEAKKKFIENKFVSVEFQIRPHIGMRKYKYQFAFGLENGQIVAVNEGHLKVAGQKISDGDIRFSRQNLVYYQKIKQKLDIIIRDDYIINFHIMGKVGRGKSTYINYTMRFLSKVYGFQFQQFPLAASSLQSVSKKFETFTLQHPSSNCKINFIDAPGAGFQSFKNKKITTKQFMEIYLQASKLVLNGCLNQDQFEIPDKIDVKNATLKVPDQSKLVHYGLVFIDLNDTHEENEFIYDLCKVMINNKLLYGMILNKAESAIGDQQITESKIQQLKLEAFKLQYNIQRNGALLFITSMDLDYFDNKNPFYREYQKSIYFALSEAIQYFQLNILSIFIIINNQKNLLKLIQIKRAKTQTLQQLYYQTNQINRRSYYEISINGIQNFSDRLNNTLYDLRRKIENKFIIEFTLL